MPSAPISAPFNPRLLPSPPLRHPFPELRRHIFVLQRHQLLLLRNRLDMWITPVIGSEIDGTSMRTTFHLLLTSVESDPRNGGPDSTG